jgi:hypothetical protein
MANVNISKWDIAQVMGLEYVGESDPPEDDYNSFYYIFHYMDKKFVDIYHDIYNDYGAGDLEEAKEQAAEKLFDRIASLVNSVHVNY